MIELLLAAILRSPTRAGRGSTTHIHSKDEAEEELERRRTRFNSQRPCTLGHFGRGLRQLFPTMEDLRGLPFRLHMITMAWVILVSILRLEVGHAGNRRSMYSGGRQAKAPRLSRISAMQLVRNLRRRFLVWMQWLGWPLHADEPDHEEEDSGSKRSHGSWGFRIFVGERAFARGGTHQSHNTAVKLSNP
jgi:hypothetical protein